MPYPAKNIANAFFDLAQSEQRKLTNMQLQKLVYFANGWNLALKHEPLITDNIKAWTFGPVIPPLYNALKKYGNGEVTQRIPVSDVALDEDSKALIAKVWSVYGGLSGSKMSAITHVDSSAWDKAFKKEKFSVIDPKLIEEEFKSQLQ